ncbi:MAG: prepilin-type N-terminal cleavage/methylation domain-containing protein [Lachnospiraceae bacterium]|nr:prepilin-type N-terminal cleavage/methylation domain-containing protein [Lachnospiraceae bacterium]
MKKEMNNKGFSLVELIIVVAIMAVLIGVLAPAYLQYVEKSKRTKDCQAVGSIMDACEIVAADVAINWTEALTVSVGSAGVTYNCADTDVVTQMEAIVSDAKITGAWTSISFEASKGNNGIVTFGTPTGNMNLTEIAKISPDLEARFN